MHRPVFQAVTVRLWSGRSGVQISGWSKPDTELHTARHRCNISSKEALLRGCYDANMGPGNSLHASA